MKYRQKKKHPYQGLIVSNSYYVLRWDRERCDHKATPFFCIHLPLDLFGA